MPSQPVQLYQGDQQVEQIRSKQNKTETTPQKVVLKALCKKNFFN